MEGVLKILIAGLVLVIGIFIGDFLARATKEELFVSKRWFMLIIFLSVIFAIASLILMNDPLLFTFLFIIIVTSRSLVKK